MKEYVDRGKKAESDLQANSEENAHGVEGKLQEITSMARIEEMIEHERREARQSISLDDLWRLCRIKEEMGLDDPFVTFSWDHWQEIQKRALMNFSRFQRAITKHEFQLAMLIALEMQEIAADLQKEACCWFE